MHSKLPEREQAAALATAFERSNAELWDQQTSLDRHEAARRELFSTTQDILSSDAFSTTTHLVLKRSFPFGHPHGRRSPDLFDVLDLPGDVRIVSVYRDPCAATYSAYRRGFDDDLRRLARSCADSLVRLAAQTSVVDPSRLIQVSYARLCRQPALVLGELGKFCGLHDAELQDALATERLIPEADMRYASELSPSEVGWLQTYFSPERRRQWLALTGQDQTSR